LFDKLESFFKRHDIIVECDGGNCKLILASSHMPRIAGFEISRSILKSFYSLN
jgi:hypothetical protein